MPRSPKITEAEWDVMIVVWEKYPITSQEVTERLSSEKEWSPQTVKTLLSRLVKKGVLSYRQKGKAYLYRPKLSKELCIRSETKSFLERVFGDTAAPALAQFVKHADLNSKEIEELRSLLAGGSKKK